MFGLPPLTGDPVIDTLFYIFVPLAPFALIFQRLRRRSILKSLTALGFHGTDRKTKLRDVSGVDYIDGNPLLLYFRNHAMWHARGVRDGRELFAMEYHYWFNAGHGYLKCVHVIVATPFPSPDSSVTVERKRIMTYHATGEKATKHRFADPDFTRKCEVYAEDPPAASAYLTPAVQQFWAKQPSRYWFRLHDDMLAVGCRIQFAAQTSTVTDLFGILDQLAELLMSDLSRE